MHSKSDFQSKVLRYIVEGAAQESTRSLELLRAIENTVEVNHLLADAFAQIAARISAAIEAVCHRPATEGPDEIIDPEGAIRKAGEHTLDVIGAMVKKMTAKRKAAMAARELSADDGVVDSYDRLIDALTDAHGLINELNWAIMEHDADRSPISGKGPFSSARALLAALCE